MTIIDKKKGSDGGELGVEVVEVEDDVKKVEEVEGRR